MYRLILFEMLFTPALFFNLFNVRHQSTLRTESICTELKMIKDEISAQKSSIFIFGLGYVGSALAREMLKEGWKVSILQSLI